MLKKIKNTLLTFGFVVSSSIVIYPNNVFADTLKIASDEWCPYDCIASQNQGKVGYLGDLLVETLKSRGHTVEFVEVSYSRGLELVREGKLDATMACFREETGLDSLKEAKMIGIIAGYDYVDKTVMDYINQKPKNVLAITGEKPLERLLNMLVNGRISTVIEDKSVLGYKINQMGKSDLIKPSGTTDAVIDVYSSFSPKNPKSKEYAKILSEETLKMRNDGRLQKLLEKYGIKDWQAN